MYTLVDSDAIGVFINKGFVEKHCLNTYKLLKTVPVYNVDEMPNKAGWISEVVNIVLHYQTHSK